MHEMMRNFFGLKLFEIKFKFNQITANKCLHATLHAGKDPIGTWIFRIRDIGFRVGFRQGFHVRYGVTGRCDAGDARRVDTRARRSIG